MGDSMKDIQLPYSNGEYATLSAKFPLDKSSWNKMIAILQVIEPGLVTENKKTTEDQELFISNT